MKTLGWAAILATISNDFLTITALALLVAGEVIITYLTNRK
jgi:hypothetical protein